MSRRIKTVITGTVVALMVLLVIWMTTQGEKREVKNLVITYNETLLRAHEELRSGIMQLLTTPQELGKIDNYFAYLLKNRRVLRGKIREISFESVKIEKDRATVATRERWEYFYVDPDSRQRVSEVYDVLYGNIYFLVRRQGHWAVDDLESKELGGKTEG